MGAPVPVGNRTHRSPPGKGLPLPQDIEKIP
jgi:hypothetical protein